MQNHIVVGGGKGVVIGAGWRQATVHVDLDGLLWIIKAFFLFLGDAGHVPDHAIVVTALSRPVGAVGGYPCPLVLAAPASMAAAHTTDHTHHQDQTPQGSTDDVNDVEGEPLVVGGEGRGLGDLWCWSSGGRQAVNCREESR